LSINVIHTAIRFQGGAWEESVARLLSIEPCAGSFADGVVRIARDRGTGDSVVLALSERGSNSEDEDE
jgi:hypothetical protein